MLRLEAALPSALERLIALVQSADQDSVRLRAAVELMDRTLGKTSDKLVLTGDDASPLEIVISRRALEPNVPSTSLDGTSEA